eukprot:TRINITY_DN4796_c0_g1_i1.p1 TRINITY_DN4796_c0_g1~~TRINITY_DN4796_c0_g1_i1.p1  ORF type:complete len:217 (+),score=49.13 TRINITY_DN4796_c0_g1_i1:248-898(+)
MDNLIEDVRALAAAKAENYQELVRERMAKFVASGSDDWKKYVFWNKHKYTRNLVEINPEFEMIVLCWDKGQASPIHNHSAQDCWYAVVEGSVEEIYYKQEGSNLVETQSHLHEFGDVGHIADDIALHLVRPTEGNRAVTIHVYSKPIPECNVYNQETGIVSAHASGFFTVYGQKFNRGDSCVYREIYKLILQDDNWNAPRCDKKTYLHFFECQMLK